MKEKIGRLARGLVDGNPAVIRITPEVIDEKLLPGEIFKSEIHLVSELRLRFRGLIYSSNPRVKLSAETYSGHFAYLGYSVDTSHLEDGDVISGRFSLVTSSGERVIPYLFTIKNARNTPESKVKIVQPGAAPAKNTIQKEKINESEPVIFDLGRNTKSASRADSKNDPRRLIALFKKTKLEYITGALQKSAAVAALQRTLDRLQTFDKYKAQSEELLKTLEDIKNDTYREYKAADDFNAYRELRFRYEKGERSPELFAAAAGILSRSLAVYSGLDPFTLMSLNFGTRYGLLSPELIELICESLVLEKSAGSLLMIMLKRLYETVPDEKILSFICSYYIKRDITDSRAFFWYARGVEKDVKSPMLYDYYMKALPDDFDERLPEEVYLYYSFNAPTDERCRRLLYLSVVKYCPADTTIGKNYDYQISQYLMGLLRSETPDASLAPLYQRFLNEKMIDGNNAGAVSDIVLSRILRDIPADVVSIAITYDELNGTQQAQVVSGSAVFPVYTEKSHIYYVTEDGEREISHDHDTEPFVTGKEGLLEVCRQYYPSMPSFLIKNAREIMSRETIDEDEVNALSYLSMAEGLSARFRTEINSAIILKFDWIAHPECKNALLESGRDRGISGQARIKYIDSLIGLEEYDEANAQIKRLGIEKISSPSLLAVCRNAIIQNGFEKDDYLLSVAWGLFAKIIFDDVSLNYLCKNYNGLVSEMKELLLESKKAGGPLYDLPERLLSQMLFANVYQGLDEVFRIYASSGTVQKNLLFAYYVVKCSLYLSKDEGFDPEIFNAIKRTLSGELMTGSAPVIMQLAVSKYFSEFDSLDGEDALICKKIVTLLTGRGIIFPYVKKLSGLIELPQEIKDKTFVSYQGKEDDHVTIAIWSEEDDDEPVVLEMTYVYAGIFVKPVLLFSGEHLSYEIRVTRDEKTEVVREGELEADITQPDEQRKFARLNRLVAGSAEPASLEWQAEMQAYALENEMVKRLF